ncbi:MAG: hypothetical protein ACK5Q5_15165 [Planctomycetaceae bacterium]
MSGFIAIAIITAVGLLLYVVVRKIVSTLIRASRAVSGAVSAPFRSSPKAAPRQSARSNAKAEAAKRSQRQKTGLTYDSFRWGDPPPTKKQFGFAVRSGLPLRDGMTSVDVSDGLDALSAPGRKAQRRSKGPQYDDFDWGNPPPTLKQFEYAIYLGIRLRDGMTNRDVSHRISAVLDERGETQ